MKKTIAIILLIIMMTLTLGCTSVKAITSEELPNVLYNMGHKYGMKKSDKARVERYVSEHEITDAECDAIVAKLREAVKIMEDANEIDFRKISKAQQNRIKQIMIEAGQIVDVKVVFKNYSIYLYDKDGKLIDVIDLKNIGKYSYTGNQFNTALPIIILVAIAPLVAGVIKKKNAKE